MKTRCTLLQRHFFILPILLLTLTACTSGMMTTWTASTPLPGNQTPAPDHFLTIAAQETENARLVTQVATLRTPDLTATLILPTPPPWPTAVPPPTIVLPNGTVATPVPVTPPSFYATQEANRRATVVARATASPFPSAQPANVQAGQPSSAITRRGGLSFEVRLPKDTYLMGEGGQAEITVRNDGAETIFIQAPVRLALVDEQGQEPAPWPWAPASWPGRGRGYQPQLAPGQVFTQTLNFQTPLAEQATGHTYGLWAETSFSRVALDNPQNADGLWLRLEAGPIPLRLSRPDSMQRLVVSLECDLSGWKLQVRDASGRIPTGPLWGELEAFVANTAQATPLRDARDGAWSDAWADTRELQNVGQMAVRAWVSAPGHVTAIAHFGSDDRFSFSYPVAHQTFTSLTEAQAVLDFPLYWPKQLPAGAALYMTQVETTTYDENRQANVTQVYLLLGGSQLRLVQMVTTERYANAGWGTARYAPEAQMVAVGPIGGFAVRRFGWWALDWKIGDVGFELQASAVELSLQDLQSIAASMTPDK